MSPSGPWPGLGQAAGELGQAAGEPCLALPRGWQGPSNEVSVSLPLLFPGGEVGAGLEVQQLGYRWWLLPAVPQ